MAFHFKQNFLLSSGLSTILEVIAYLGLDLSREGLNKNAKLSISARVYRSGAFKTVIESHKLAFKIFKGF